MFIPKRFWNWLRNKFRRAQPPPPSKMITVAKIEVPEPKPPLESVFFLNPQPGYKYDLRRPEQIEITTRSVAAQRLHITHTIGTIHTQLVTRKMK